MSRVWSLVKAYEAQLRLRWETGLHGAERTWFAVHDKMDERKLRALIGEFELATKRADRNWRLYDVADAFEKWLAASEDRDAYFVDPDFLKIRYAEFAHHLTDLLKRGCGDTDNTTVFAIVGVGSLFGFAHVSTVVSGLADNVPGRLLVFFPGSVEGNTFRLLDARDGWNYRAVVITADKYR